MVAPSFAYSPDPIAASPPSCCTAPQVAHFARIYIDKEPTRHATHGGETMKYRLPLIAVLAAAALAIPLIALGAGHGRDKPRLVYVFKLELKPKKEVPAVTGLRADARGNVTLDVTRNSAGAITSGKVVFYFNYSFPGPVQFTGLHIHQAPKGSNGPIVVDSGAPAFADADGQGNITTVVTSVSAATLQAIVANSKSFYVNLHTTTKPAGAMRGQLKGPHQHEEEDDGD
jgi:CHRD domain-containing protein